MSHDTVPIRGAGNWFQTVRIMTAHLHEVVAAQATIPEELPTGPHAHARGFIAGAISGAIARCTRTPDAPDVDVVEQFRIAEATLTQCLQPLPHGVAAITQHLRAIGEAVECCTAAYTIIGPDLARARLALTFFRQLARAGAAEQQAEVAPIDVQGDARIAAPAHDATAPERSHG